MIDLSQGVPGSAPPEAVLEAFANASRDPETAKYGPILGEPELRQALAVEMSDLYRLTEESIKSEDVAITTGCNMAFLALIMALCPPNESSVLLPAPNYFNYNMTVSQRASKG